MPATYEPIASQTLGSDAADITFSSIPGTYTDLVASVTYANSTQNYAVAVRYNNDTGNNYSNTILYGSGATSSSTRHTSTSYSYISYFGATSATSTSTPANVQLSIMQYANTSTFKTFLSAAAGSGSGNGVDRIVGLWRSTSAITSVTFLAAPAGNLKSGSTFSLYGIKAA